MRLKSWESPRSGRRRNDKSKQASARLRQLKKQTQQLRKRLKSTNANTTSSNTTKPSGSAPGGFDLQSLELHEAERRSRNYDTLRSIHPALDPNARPFDSHLDYSYL